MIGSANYKGAKEELDRRAGEHRIKIDRQIALASLIAAAIAAVASVIAPF